MSADSGDCCAAVGDVMVGGNGGGGGLLGSRLNRFGLRKRVILSLKTSSSYGGVGDQLNKGILELRNVYCDALSSLFYKSAAQQS